MNVDFIIQAFLAEPKLFQELTDDIDSWGKIESLYTVTETIGIPEKLVKKIADEQKKQTAPQVYLKYMTDGAKWSKLERIHHKTEVEHRERFRARLESSGRFTVGKILELTNRFHVMIYPSHNIWFHQDSSKISSKALQCWSNIEKKLYKNIDGKIHFTGFTPLDGTIERDEYIPAWQNMADIAFHYEVKPGTQVIDEDAFKLWDIEQVTIPESVEKIIGNPFGDSKYKERYITDIISHSPRFIAENGIFYEKLNDGTKRLIYCFDKSIRMVEDPDVSIVEKKAFKDCCWLQDVCVPNANLIKSKAFQNCTSLLSFEPGSDVLISDNIQNTFDCPFIWHLKSLRKT